MKKIISICALIISVALLITAFTACGKDKVDETLESTTAEAVVEGSFSLEVSEKKAVVKKGDEVFQELSYPTGIDYGFDLEYAKEHYEFIDMNFDGNPDLYLAVSKVDNVINYYCWLYNVTNNKFEYSASLSALKNISVDPYEQLILSKYYYNGVEKVSTYEWVDGVLQFKETFGDEGTTIPQNIIQSYTENTIGEVSNSEKTTAVATTTAPQISDGSTSSDKTTNPPKTTKPLLTTTAPAGGIVLHTADPESDVWY